MLKKVHARFRATFARLVLALAIAGVLAGTPLAQPVRHADCPTSTCDHG